MPSQADDEGRVILVSGRNYRCREEQTAERSTDIRIIVVPDEPNHQGRPLRLHFDAPKHSVLLDVPQVISRVQLRRAIRSALNRGWEPDAAGGVFEA